MMIKEKRLDARATYKNQLEEEAQSSITYINNVLINKQYNLNFPQY